MFRCATERRRALVRDADAAEGQRDLNGIDYLEVASADQRTLELVFLKPLPGEANGVPAAPVLTADNLVIEGGVRVTGIAVDAVSAAANVLTITVGEAGDFSGYTLRLVAGAGSSDAPDGFDPLLAEVVFSFKAGCPSEFDCAPVEVCPPEPLLEPDIDYLARDYA
ncbi:MAG: putative baseplate assembly protein, partial [Longimicrobiales bacterium]